MLNWRQIYRAVLSTSPTALLLLVSCSREFRQVDHEEKHQGPIAIVVPYTEITREWTVNNTSWVTMWIVTRAPISQYTASPLSILQSFTYSPLNVSQFAELKLETSKIECHLSVFGIVRNCKCNFVYINVNCFSSVVIMKRNVVLRKY